MNDGSSIGILVTWNLCCSVLMLIRLQFGHYSCKDLEYYWSVAKHKNEWHLLWVIVCELQA